MAIVPFEKSYEFFVNHQFGSGMTEMEQNAYVFWKIKDRLINWTQGAWSVHSSSDGSSNVGAADYWLDYTTDILWNETGLAHSWVVLERPDGAQLLIECRGPTTRTDYITCKWSHEGLFTGGSLTNPPSAADQQALLDRNQWYDTAGPRTMYMHLIHATDGSIDHMLLTYNGAAFFYWCSQTVLSPVDNYTLHNVFFARENTGVTSYRTTYAMHTEAQYWAGKKSVTADSEGLFRFGLTTLIGNSAGTPNDMGALVPLANSISGKCVLYPIGIVSMSVGYEGRHGRFADHWMAPGSLATGTTIEENPLSPTYEIAVFPHMAIPWDGTVPVVS